MATQSVPPTVSQTLSPKKLDANRRNAQKSTGPKTAEGKAVVSQNAVKHGLTSRFCPILPGEDPEEFNAYRLAMMRDVKPRGILQTEFVDDLVIVRWKLKRISKIEAEMMSRRQTRLIEEYEQEVADRKRCRSKEVVPEPRIDPIHILPGILPGNEKSSFALMDLYRERLLRAQYAVLRELRKLRKLREETGEEVEAEGSCSTGVPPVPQPAELNEQSQDETQSHGQDARGTEEAEAASDDVEAVRGTDKATADIKSLAGLEKRSANDALGRAIDGALPQIARLDRMIKTLAGMETRE